jgi:peptidoglycan biosynthesis protein MviN/MurJ (putative lipid II flippase)
MVGFQRFLRQLSASSLENLGYCANQLLLVYSIAQAGTGAVSANTCAFRVGMIGFTLLGQPLAQLAQAKFCAADDTVRYDVFRKWLAAISTVVVIFAVALFVGREPLTRIVYLHGRFSAVELAKVLQIVPAWVAYFVVASLNAIVARYLFAAGQGSGYVRRQLCAYAAANVMRIALWGKLDAPAMIWCTVLAEGCALLVSLQSGRQQMRRAEPVLEAALAGVREV